jgi:hypothetical protein
MFDLTRTDRNFAAPLFVKVNARFDFEDTPAAFDSISISLTGDVDTVPEPSTLVLCATALALGSLAGVRRRLRLLTGPHLVNAKGGFSPLPA